MRKQIIADNIAKSTSPFSHGIVSGGPVVYVSGQGPFDLNGELVSSKFSGQALQAFKNVGLVLEAAGSSWSDVVKTNIYLRDISNFAEMNDTYQQFVLEPYPARTTIEASFAKEGMLIEVDCIALIRT